MATGPAGYSGKPVFQKLGLKPGMTVCPLHPPRDYAGLIPGAEGVTILAEQAPADVVHPFCATRSVVAAEGPAAPPLVADPGMLWLSWPKKSSKLCQDLTEDGLREVMLPTGWVDVKVCAVDADWSGLKFLRRKTT